MIQLGPCIVDLMDKEWRGSSQGWRNRRSQEFGHFDDWSEIKHAWEEANLKETREHLDSTLNSFWKERVKLRVEGR